jgi:hypothetical protein|tara:strand:+ start:3244 stop:5958 length:2715 start_codon:yes stop_codon:yes gene_type:complete
MATNPYRNKYDEEDDLSYLKQGKTKIDWPLSDGSTIALWVHRDILEERNTSGSDYLYPKEQRLEYVHEEIKKQYDQSIAETARAGLRAFQSGAALYLDDELLSVTDALVAGETNPDFAANLARRRREAEWNAMHSPNLQVFGEGTGMLLGALRPGAQGTAAAKYAALVARGSPQAAGFRAALGRGLDKYAPVLSQPTGRSLTRTPTGGLAPQSMAPRYQKTLQELYDPFKIGSARGSLGVAEGAAKGGAFGAAIEAGRGEGDERFSNVGAGTMGGAVLGGAIPGTIGMIRGIPSAWRTAKPLWNKDAAQQVLKDRARMEIQRGAQDYIRESAVLDDIAAGRGTSREKLLNREIGGEGYYGDITDVIAPTGYSLQHARNPYDTSGLLTPPLATRTGSNVRVGDDPKPLFDHRFSNLWNWASRVDDSSSTSRLRDEYKDVVSSFPIRVAAALKRHMPDINNKFKQDTDLEAGLTAIGERSRSIWGPLYRSSYFEPSGTPRLVNLGAGNSFAFKMTNDPGTYQKAVAHARQSRASDIADKEWDRTIMGLNQQIPEYEMLLAGQRWVPKSTFRRHADELENNGWTLVREKSGRGTRIREDENGLNYMVSNPDKPIDIKTIHDIKISLNALATKAEAQGDGGRAGQLKRSAELWNNDLKVLAGDDFIAADAKFANHENIKAAAAFGKDTNIQTTTPTPYARGFDEAGSEEARRQLRVGVIQQIRESKITAEDILNSPDMQANIKKLLVERVGANRPEQYNKLVGELAEIAHTEKTFSGFGDPFMSTPTEQAGKFQNILWSALAKIPAYKFSAPFALSRDIVILSKNVASSNNQIVAKEVLRLGKAKTPAEVATALEELSFSYRERLPKDASDLANLAAAIRQMLAPQEQDLLDPVGVGKEVIGLLSEFT